MTGEYEARIIEEPAQWTMNRVRLMVRRGSDFLLADGSWHTFVDGDILPDEVGLPLPRQAIEAIAVALQEYQGHASHADTEARVLREWLMTERGRVERLIERGLVGFVLPDEDPE